MGNNSKRNKIMAKEMLFKNNAIDSEVQKVLVLTKQEATDIIGLLAAQLGDCPLSGNDAGACPTITVTNSLGKKYDISLIIGR